MDEELKKILEITAKNSEDIKKNTEDIRKMVKTVKNYIVWQQVYDVFKILVIFVPLIVGTILVWPYFKQLGPLIDNGLGAMTGNVESLDADAINKLITPELMKKIQGGGQ